jgi:hypothetical protein
MTARLTFALVAAAFGFILIPAIGAIIGKVL